MPKASNSTDTTTDTGQKQEPGPINTGGAGNADGSMPMGMLGGAPGPGEGDPDQKSTHNAPKTVESNLPDGSPKFMDASRVKRMKGRSSAGMFEVVSPIRVAVGELDSETRRRPTQTHQPGDIVELSELDAESLGDAIKPARERDPRRYR